MSEKKKPTTAQILLAYRAELLAGDVGETTADQLMIMAAQSQIRDCGLAVDGDFLTVDEMLSAVAS